MGSERLAPPIPEEIESAVRPLVVLFQPVAKGIDWISRQTLLPFLPALAMLVKRNPKSPHVRMLDRLARLLANGGVLSQTLTEPLRSASVVCASFSPTSPAPFSL